MSFKLKPGPRPTSCLTCRKRRKKCDLAQPNCESCLKGGYECLGYEDSDARGGIHRDYQDMLSVLAPLQWQPALPTVPAPPTASKVAGDPYSIGTLSLPLTKVVHLSAPNLNPAGATISPSVDHQNLSSTGGYYEPAPPIFEHALLYHLSRPTVRTNDNGAVTAEDSNYSWLQSQVRSTKYDHIPTRRPSNASELLGVNLSAQPKNNHSSIIQVLCESIPPSMYTNDMIKEDHFLHIIGEYQTRPASYWFTVPPSSIRDSVATRLKASKSMTWVSNLGGRLFQSFREDPRGTMTIRCISWIDKLEEKLCCDFRGSSNLDDASDFVLAQLEIACLKFTMIDSISGYLVLRRALPGFLHLIATSPGLYTEYPNGNLVVSFPRTFGALEYELKRFVLFDTITALVLGVSPLVEYAYDGECDPTAHGLEWTHGVPAMLVEVISQVNSWRAGSRVAPLDNWRNLEKRVLAWQPRPPMVEDDCSSADSVAKIAVQEVWRHVTLIYVYMGIHGVSSHDTRVQASIRQIIQLGGPITSLPIGTHMFVYCIIVGLGARYEKHRHIVRARLLSLKGLNGVRFVRILDHLWHGAGAGGAPVTWDDYVQSRWAIAPV